MSTSQYGFPIAKNPILLQNFTDVKDGFLEISKNHLKFEIILKAIIY
jgi:hypothetical protein